MTKKIRLNITVDKKALDKARTKLHLFGGKLSTLFNSYLHEFVRSIDRQFSGDHKILVQQIRDLEARVSKLENHII